MYQTNVQSVHLTWKAPLKKFVKINCDGAWNPHGSTTGIWVIFRDHNGFVVAYQSLFLNNVTNSLDSEGLALKFGMLLAKDLKLHKVIFETDSNIVAEILWFKSSLDHAIQDS